MRTRLFLFVGILVAGTAIVSTQTQRGPSTLDDVVSELRGLRAELRQTTRSTAQMQLLTARVQLQEQRLAVLSNQRNELSVRLAAETQARQLSESNVQRFEEMKTKNDVGIPRADIEGQANFFKQQFSMHRELEVQMRTQDSQLAAEIANEQNRWQDFNSRLDELERSLK